MPSQSLYIDLASVEWTPDTPHALVQTLHWPAIQFPVLLSCAISQHLSLFPHALVLQVLDAY